MRLLLDTQLALWWLTESARVSATLRDLIENAADAVFVSRASLWEMAIKIGTGRLRVDLSRFAHQVTTDGFLWLNIENRHILEVVSLPHFDDHKDPFDRLLVAQSLSEPLIFLTADAKLARYGSTIRLV